MRATPKRVAVESLDKHGSVEVSEDGEALNLRFTDAAERPVEALITRSTAVAIADALEVFTPDH